MQPKAIDPSPSTSADTRITLAGVFAVVGAAVMLRLAQDVFLPLAIAMLIAFALSPLVSILRRFGLSMVVSALMVTALAFAAIALFSLIVFGQLGELASNLPTFQANILTKLTALQSAGEGNGLMTNALSMLRAINSEIGAALPGETAPMPVKVVENVSAFGLLQSIIVPVISPVATSGLVVILVIFMLLDSETLRDRFIRLVGSNDLYRTTQMLGEAGSRVGAYLLTQLLVNSIYALPIGLGLWLIGVPNPVLWGVLTLILRFVPFIGSALAAAFPLFLAFAVSPDWTAVLWTAALFITVEAITSNIIEPWLYGSRTGLSSLAIIIAALFWTFLWGPPGLVLATPLTVCLVVLGRHIPQLAFFDILLGDAPPLDPYQQLYQRLLTGNRVESLFHAEELLVDQDLTSFYQDTALPALILAQDDRDRGVLTPEQEANVAATALHLVSELASLTPITAEAPDAPSVTCIGGRRAIDDVTASMLAQSLDLAGVPSVALSFADLAPSRFAKTAASLKTTVILCFLDPNPSRASLLHIHRIKRLSPQTRVGVVIWDHQIDPQSTDDLSPRALPTRTAEAMAIGADFVATSFATATDWALSTAPAIALPDLPPPTTARNRAGSHVQPKPAAN